MARSSPRGRSPGAARFRAPGAVRRIFRAYPFLLSKRADPLDTYRPRSRRESARIDIYGGNMVRSLLLALFLALPLPATAALLGDPSVPFSADRTVVVDGRTFAGRVYAVPGKQRHELEIEGIPQVILLHADGRGWLVVPTLKSYVEFGWAQVLAELGDAAALGTPVGEETVGGLKATKYRVEHTARD